MSKPTLVIVNGLPCTGKTSLADYLASELSLPLITKDGIKETLFDTLGYSDRAWSQQLGSASMELLYYFIAAELQAGRSFLAEANFHSEIAGSKFQALLEGRSYRVVQILCHTDSHVLLERYRRRAQSSERHPGHLDVFNEDDFRSIISLGDWVPIPLESELIFYDTTNPAADDMKRLAGRIGEMLK